MLKKWLVVIGMVLALFFVNSLALTVKVGVYSNPPLSFYKNGQAQGIFPDVLNYIAKKEGWTIDYIYAPLPKLLKELNAAKVDVVCPMAYTNSRVHKYDFSHEYLLSNWTQVYVPFGSSINNPFDLKNRSVGVLRSDVFYEGKHGIRYFLGHLGVHAKFVKFNTYSAIFEALKKRKIAAGVVDRIFGDSNKFKYDLKETPIIFSPIEEKFAFSKESAVAKIVAPTIDKYVLNMKSDPKSILNLSIERYLEHVPTGFRMPKWVIYLIFASIAAFLVLLANIIILRRLVKKRTEELSEKNKQLRVSNEELTASNEEINTMNEELENAYTNLEAANARFQNVSALLSQLDMVNVGEEKFLNQVLDKTLELIPQAKYGSVSLLEGGKWRFVACRGHDIKLLSALPLKSEYAYFANKGQAVSDILEKREETIPPKIFEKITKATKPIKQSLIAPMKFSNEIMGYITVDIPKESVKTFSKEDMKTIDNFAKIASAFYVARKYLRYHEELQNKLIFVMVKALEKFHKYTEGHSEHVAECSMKLAKRLGLNEKEQKKIYQASLLHDVGKIFISKSILDKNGKLTEKEYEEVKKHPITGAELIEEGTELKDIAKIVKHHHERWDGKGYPDGLRGEDIPIACRIMAVCDTFDAMTSDRAYRKALSKSVALEEIERNAGKQFDPSVTREFLKMMKE